MIVKELPGNIYYIEDAFPHAQEFIDNIEKYENDERTHSVIPPWQDWRDSRPIKVGDSPIHWEIKLDDFTKGKQKLFDWDRTASDLNEVWPRPIYTFEDEAHNLVEKTIDLLDKPYREILQIWAEKTGNEPLEHVSRNYFLRKYHVDGSIGPHIDKNKDNPRNTMDWSVLFYLNDEYAGGEISFPELDLRIKPSKGSAIIFPCTTVHVAEPVKSGEKYYIFMVIHSEFGYSTALSEEYQNLNEVILKHKGLLDHPLLQLPHLP
jgi:hypothetical protein